ncbi:hypothetical protein AXG93_4003s1000 [Marchantia polymorpha subsp. ruderalis]|uniref:Uncharacterized protein n=1 Tax=Marchantia polymorpha subsp. ruderalis TaxID=1480154 RepID=A0A176W975_MARPO|nr:hypothetical protein AXG93_4003s1000 [Marchantia polymorpha subsp. ruderalis]
MLLRWKDAPLAEEEKKRKMAEESTFAVSAFGVRRRANNEQARPKQKARKLILPPDSRPDIGRAAVARDSPSFEEDMSAEILERLRKKRCLPSEQVPFDDSPSEQGPSALEQFRVVPSAETPSAPKPLEHIPTGEGRNAETRVPSTEAPLAVTYRDDVVGPSGAGSPTPLEVLA